MLRHITFCYFKSYEEAGTETDSPALTAYGLVCATRGTKLRSRSEEE